MNNVCHDSPGRRERGEEKRERGERRRERGEEESECHVHIFYL